MTKTARLLTKNWSNLVLATIVSAIALPNEALAISFATFSDSATGFFNKREEHEQFGSRFHSTGLLLTDLGGRCSANLIRNEWAVTAAHCFFDTDAGGNIDFNQRAQGVSFFIEGAQADVSNIIVHKDYINSPSFRSSWSRDIALIKLDFVGAIPQSLRPIELYTGNRENGQLGATAGFGVIGTGISGVEDTNAPSGTPLRYAGTNNIFSPTSGRSLLTDFDDPFIILRNNLNPFAFDYADGDLGPATKYESSVLPGDSGGGLYMKDPDTGNIVLTGITAGILQQLTPPNYVGIDTYSYQGRQIAEQGTYGSLNFFPRIGNYAGWIENVVRNANLPNVPGVPYNNPGRQAIPINTANINEPAIYADDELFINRNIFNISTQYIEDTFDETFDEAQFNVTFANVIASNSYSEDILTRSLDAGIDVSVNVIPSDIDIFISEDSNDDDNNGDDDENEVSVPEPNSTGMLLLLSLSSIFYRFIKWKN